MKESQGTAHLVIKKNKQILTRFAIKPDDTVLTIGRHSSNDINLTGDSTISRVHAALVRCAATAIDIVKGLREEKNLVYLIRDLGSTQGTKVGRTFSRKRVLKDGDEIHIGSYTLVWRDTGISEGGDPGLPLEERFSLLQPLSEYERATILAAKRREGVGPLSQDQIEFIINIASGGFPEDLLENPGDFLLPLMTLLRADKALVGCHDESQAHITYQRGFDRESPHCSPDFLEKVSKEGPIRQEGALWLPLPENGFVALFRIQPPAFSEEDLLFSRYACESLVTMNTSVGEADVLTPWHTPIVGLTNLRNKCLQIAETEDVDNSDVLILGETGTGKEVLARFIHEQSNRKSKPFITANCSSLPLDLVYSELFGHEKGAFTNATEKKAGYFEMAQGGTLFLDEIGDVPEHVQVTFLTALQQRRIQRLGSKESIPVDVRIIGATDRDVDEKIRDNTFRRALYERFAYKLMVPPLRERNYDIPLLAYYFLDRYSRDVRAISREALECLRNYEWPGNVRELQDVIKAAVMGKKEFIFSWDLPDAIRYAKKVQRAVRRTEKTLKEMEKERIIEVLEETRGNVGEAIRVLGISRATLYNKVREYGLQIPRKSMK